MTTLAQTYASDVAFTPAVKAIQARKGSRHSYARVEQRGWRTEVVRPGAQLPELWARLTVSLGVRA